MDLFARKLLREQAKRSLYLFVDNARLAAIVCSRCWWHLAGAFCCPSSGLKSSWARLIERASGLNDFCKNNASESAKNQRKSSIFQHALVGSRALLPRLPFSRSLFLLRLSLSLWRRQLLLLSKSFHARQSQRARQAEAEEEEASAAGASHSCSLLIDIQLLSFGAACGGVVVRLCCRRRRFRRGRSARGAKNRRVAAAHWHKRTLTTRQGPKVTRSHTKVSERAPG